MKILKQKFQIIILLINKQVKFSYYYYITKIKYNFLRTKIFQIENQKIFWKFKFENLRRMKWAVTVNLIPHVFGFVFFKYFWFPNWKTYIIFFYLTFIFSFLILCARKENIIAFFYKDFFFNFSLNFIYYLVLSYKLLSIWKLLLI